MQMLSPLGWAGQSLKRRFHGRFSKRLTGGWKSGWKSSWEAISGGYNPF